MGQKDHKTSMLGYICYPGRRLFVFIALCPTCLKLFVTVRDFLRFLRTVKT